MKFQIVVDSSCDLKNDYIIDDEIGFKVIPLTINVNGKEFYDDDNVDAQEVLRAMHEYSGKSTTSCPPPGAFLEAFERAENTICINITSKLSGSYNSALQAKKIAAESGHNVHVIDSKLVCGAMILIVDKAYELMKQDLSFEEITKQLDEYTKELHLLFVLQKFDNFVKSGRMNKLSGVLASILFIKPLCVADDGEIKILEKIRTAKSAFKRLVDVIADKINDFSNRKCIISHCQDEELALDIKDKIKEKYNFKDVIIVKMKALCSYYALEKGIIVCF